MNQIAKSGNTFLFRLNRGEELISSLSAYCNKHNVTGGYFWVIGAAKTVTLSYYNLEEKTYEDHFIQEDTEILSVMGNISLLDTQISIHAHGVFGKRDITTIGGHIKKLIISATGEVVLTTFPQPVTRSFDKITGLNLLN